MNREIIQNDDPRLKLFNNPVSNFNDSNLKQIVDDLIDSMQFNGLIGIAAPQIGVNLRIFVTEPRETNFRTADQVDKLRIYINPNITNFSKEKVLIWEGCGSYKKSTQFGPVERPKEITIEASDLDGKKFRFTCDGILARVIQHEYDHLDGVEFVDRMDNISELKDANYYLSKIKNQPKIIEASVITKKKFEQL